MRRLVLALSLALAACQGDQAPPDARLDGNVLIGDATEPDARAPADARPDGDAEAMEAGTDGGDAGFDDRGVPDAGDPCAEPPVVTLTASAAIAALDRYEGQVIGVTGTSSVSSLTCTERPCEPAMPCCNTCTATVAIDGWLPLVDSECVDPAPGCAGSECGVVCTPATLGLVQRFIGRLTQGRQGPALMLHRVLQ